MDAKSPTETQASNELEARASEVILSPNPFVSLRPEDILETVIATRPRRRARFKLRRLLQVVVVEGEGLIVIIDLRHIRVGENLGEAEAAIRTIIRWAGEDPQRDGLIETPARVARALEEAFAGYTQDPLEFLNKTFEETEGYDEMIALRGVRFESYCEHHMAPITGQAWVAYVPSGRVVGISKLARVVEVYAKHLQIQERLTAQIANAIDAVLKPQGVGVLIRATHHCMTARGVRKPGSDLVTSRMLGCFRDNPLTRQEFLALAV